jgi:hypothetical protein
MRTISKHGRGSFAAIGRQAVTYNPHLVKDLMMTLLGRLERMDNDLPNDRWVQVGTVVAGGKTLIARGTEQVALSNLREGEFVEVTFRSAHTGLVKADAIYAQPEPMINKSKSRAQRRLKSTNRTAAGK